MVIFNSYVSLPEGATKNNKRIQGVDRCGLYARNKDNKERRTKLLIMIIEMPSVQLKYEKRVMLEISQILVGLPVSWSCRRRRQTRTCHQWEAPVQQGRSLKATGFADVLFLFCLMWRFDVSTLKFPHRKRTVARLQLGAIHLQRLSVLVPLFLVV